MMTKSSIFLTTFSSGLVVLADLPIYFIFGIVFVAAMIEAKKIEKRTYPILSNLIASAITGWGTSFGVKAWKAEWFESDARIFVMLVTTLFSYSLVVYFLKNEVISKLIEKYLKNKTNHVDENNSDS